MGHEAVRRRLDEQPAVGPDERGEPAPRAADLTEGISQPNKSSSSGKIMIRSHRKGRRALMSDG